MAWTTHGHHIPGTPQDPNKPSTKARCGGVVGCLKCQKEMIQTLLVEARSLDSAPPDLRPEDKARVLVGQWMNRYLENVPDAQKLTLKNVYIVWFSKTLQNWKALVCTDIPDQMYFEVSYNGDKHETYLDAYVKLENLAIPDGGKL